MKFCDIILFSCDGLSLILNNLLLTFDNYCDTLEKTGGAIYETL